MHYPPNAITIPVSSCQGDSFVDRQEEHPLPLPPATHHAAVRLAGQRWTVLARAWANTTLRELGARGSFAKFLHRLRSCCCCLPLAACRCPGVEAQWKAIAAFQQHVRICWRCSTHFTSSSHIFLSIVQETDTSLSSAHNSDWSSCPAAPPLQGKRGLGYLWTGMYVVR